MEEAQGFSTRRRVAFWGRLLFVMLSEPSVQSLFVLAMGRELELGTGTAFVAQHQSRDYLVTNYHIAAGRNPTTGQPLHSSGATPEILKVVFLQHHKSDRLEWQGRDVPVVNASGGALWLEHPRHGRAVDVVALPLPAMSDVMLNPYPIGGDVPALQVRPSSDVSIVGFPFGMTAGGAFAIWSRGAIASEPDVDLDELPKFLVDSRTRRGQSGSPVIAHSPGGMTAMADGGTTMFTGPVTNLLGVYSGRINEQSDLGIVWKVQAIRDIIEGGIRGQAAL
jgi:hypothetical protein